MLLLALWKTGEVYDPLRHAAAREAERPSPIEVSLGDLLERVDLEFLVGDDPLQPRVLALQLAQPFGVVGLHPAVLVAPAVVGLLRDLDLLRCLGERLPLTGQPLHLPQLAHDLLRRVPASFHRDVLLCPPSRAKGLSSTAVPFQGFRSAGRRRGRAGSEADGGPISERLLHDWWAPRLSTFALGAPERPRGCVPSGPSLPAPAPAASPRAIR